MANTQNIHPSSLVPKDWIVSNAEIKVGPLTVESHIEPPSEASVSGLTHHLLMVSTQAGSTRQITRLGNQEYDGPGVTGAFFLAAANDKSGFWAWDGTDEAIMFTLDPRQLQDVAREIGYKSSGDIALKNIPFGVDEHIKWLAQQFKQELDNGEIGGLGGRLYCESLSNLFVLHLLRNYSYQQPSVQRSAGGLGTQRLNRVLEYINAHLAENFGLEDLAKIAGLSKCHFSEMFKHSIGTSPYRYVLLRRIDLAKRCLNQDHHSIGEIALRCGFSDQSHLTKNFRKFVGTTPRAFRER